MGIPNSGILAPPLLGSRAAENFSRRGGRSGKERTGPCVGRAGERRAGPDHALPAVATSKKAGKAGGVWG